MVRVGRALWRPDRGGTVALAIEALARAAITDATRGVAPPIGPVRLAISAEILARDILVAGEWDADPMLLGTPGGTVDLATGALRPAAPGDRITRATLVTPAETAECPRWTRFLDEAMGGDAALVGFLRRFLGYALTGSTAEHALLFGHGDGGNGKTVFSNVVRAILGEYAVAAAPDILAHRGGAAARGHSAELAMLRGARLVTAAETEQGQALAEARLKLLTGGDPITARCVGRDFFTFTPRFKLVVMGNHMPVLRTVDAAIERRVCLVPFTTRPAVPERDLEARLMAEAPGILAWMIEGCRDWRAEGLGRPARVRAATAAYLAGQDVVGGFLHEACETGPDCLETAAALYAAWCAYAKAAGETPGSRRGLAFALERRGMVRVRSRHARLYRGLRLLTPEERAEDPRHIERDAS